MKVEANFQTITVSDIPNVENLTSVEINLQEGFCNLYYKGWVPPNYGATMTLEPTPDAARYDGELDDPDHPRLPLGAEVLRRDASRDPQIEEISTTPRVVARPVKDNPQA